MSLFYEDIEAGQEFTSPGRTITEADLVGFAQLSGDWNPIHTDAEFAKDTRFGQRVVHGLFGLSVLTGLLDKMGTFDGSAVAMLGIQWTFKKPVFIGDTLRFRMRIEGKRLTSDGRYGIVDRRFFLQNQCTEVVQEGTIGLMIRRREEGGHDGQS